MSFERRLAVLESRNSVGSASTDAKERLGAKIASMVRRGRRGGEMRDLQQQSVASLLALVLSHPRGAVPFDLATVATKKARALNPAAAKLVRRSLEIKGCHHGG